MNELAFKLAAEGKSNAEIWGALELTSGALQKVIQTNPQLIFKIIQGRTQFIEPLIETIMSMASGVDVTQPEWIATNKLLERAEHQNKSLTSAYEFILLAGTGAAPSTERRDPATVTELLRKKA